MRIFSLASPVPLTLSYAPLWLPEPQGGPWLQEGGCLVPDSGASSDGCQLVTSSRWQVAMRL